MQESSVVVDEMILQVSNALTDAATAIYAAQRAIADYNNRHDDVRTADERADASAGEAEVSG